MRIDVHYFAVLADRIGSSADTLDLRDGTTVSAAMDALAERHDIIRSMRHALAAAVGTAYVPAHHTLRDGDTLAIIPPVSGG
jgi:molybdopterin synthase sulfur carrier subunit